MALTITLSQYHATGEYHREGLTIGWTAPLRLTQAQVDELGKDAISRIRNDKWLHVTEEEDEAYAAQIEAREQHGKMLANGSYRASVEAA